MLVKQWFLWVHQWDILSPGRKWDILLLGQFVVWVESGIFCRLGQFVARKMPQKQWFFMSASVGHFVVGEEMGHFVAVRICRMGKKWDILSSGTICRPKNAGGTICRWDKMSPNR